MNTEQVSTAVALLPPVIFGQVGFEIIFPGPVSESWSYLFFTKNGIIFEILSLSLSIVNLSLIISILLLKAKHEILATVPVRTLKFVYWFTERRFMVRSRPGARFGMTWNLESRIRINHSRSTALFCYEANMIYLLWAIMVLWRPILLLCCTYM